MPENNKISRRQFVKTGGLIGAAAVMPTGRSGAGLLLKHLIPEDELIPGVSYWLNSTCNECPAGCGVQVRLIDSNATKIEGNKRHPVNYGGLCARGQSGLQGLYSPRRLSAPQQRGKDGTFERVNWQDALDFAGKQKRDGKIIIVGRHVSGALATLIERLQAQSPDLEHVVYETLQYPFIPAANRACFGIDAIPISQFDKSKLIVSFGADFLETWISPVSYAYGYAQTRSLRNDSMGRFIQFESHWSMTGANADERFAIPPGSELALAGAIALEMASNADFQPEELKRWREALQQFSVEKAAAVSGVSAEKIRDIISLLRSQKPSLVIAGGPTSRSKDATALQALVNLINYSAENYGQTISFGRFENSPVASHRDLLGVIEQLEKGRVAALIVHDTSLEFSFPDQDRLQKALEKAPLKIKLMTVEEETAGVYDMLLPILHWTETWDLVEPRTGLQSVRQPIIQPFTDARHPGQVLADVVHAVAGNSEPAFDYENFVQTEWDEVRKQIAPDQDFQTFWKNVLDEGGVWMQPVERSVKLSVDAASLISKASVNAPPANSKFLLPVPTVRYGDGRHTDKLWLNELPDPITTIVWDTPVLISPRTAMQWKCKTGDTIKFSSGKTILEAPVYVQEGTHDSVVAFPLGTAGDHAPFHAYSNGNPMHGLSGKIDEDSGALVWTDSPVEFKEVVGRLPLAQAQGSFEQGPRGIAQAVFLDEIGQPDEEREAPHAVGELYPPYEYPVHKWAMAIDLTLCIGCGACAVACQAENNVFVVGKEQCLRRRQLSWLRVQRFSDKGSTIFQPMLCQHCGHAPCEPVCPVYASIHNSEGLNVQVYNRCVGTRYCANNCPYKVRRFNWFTYKYPPPLQRQFTPFVSIRTRGTMEKCTFCIQRIREHKEIAKDEKRSLRDDEVVPACAQSCPTGAIRFGDLKNEQSWIAGHFQNPRGYFVLEFLNTRPSIVYMKKMVHKSNMT